jgi:predicted RNA binding protein YcfA (HicA-like mRNA interferase family)
MPRARDLLRFLKKQGFREIRQTGSHLILGQKERGPLGLPVHTGDVPKGLFLRILKDAGFTV